MLEFVGFGGAGSGAGTGGTLHGTNSEIVGLGQAFKAREYVEECSHVGRLLLDPDDFAGVGMLSDGTDPNKTRACPFHRSTLVANFSS